MRKKERALLAIEQLKQIYPDAVCSLDYEKAYELLISVRLAAQCTDARVNQITPILFGKYDTLEKLAKAPMADVQEIVKPCGLGRQKGKDIVLMSQMLIEEFGSVVPDNMEDLLKLPGVGRKTANLILGDVYHKPAVVTDTHCIRISGRLGLTENKEPFKVEKDLVKILPPQESNNFCHRLVLFGRDTCKARSPLCGECTLTDICKDFQTRKKKEQKKAEATV